MLTLLSKVTMTAGTLLIWLSMSQKPIQKPRQSNPCIRLRRGHLCRLDMSECRPDCPLHKTKDDIEKHKGTSI